LIIPVFIVVKLIYEVVFCITLLFFIVIAFTDKKIGLKLN
jgi:hypothetical protein